MSIMGLRKIFSISVGIHIGKFRLRLGSLMVIILMALALLFILALIPGGRNPRTSRPGEGPVRQVTAVVARVDGYKVDRQDFEQRFIRLLKQQPGAVDIPEQAFVRYQLLESIIEQHLLAQAAKKEGLRVSASEVSQRIKEMADNSINSQFPDKKMLRTYLERKGLSYQDYEKQVRKVLESNRDQLQESMLLEKLEGKIKSQVHVTEETVKDAYTQVKVRHILIKPKKTTEQTPGKDGSTPSEQQESPDGNAANQNAKEQARQKANELLNKIRQGADFAELAREHSDDPGSAEKGGDLGWIGRRQMIKEFSDAAFALKPGEVSDVVETPFGFHIIKMEDKRIKLPEDFEENKQRYISLQQSEREREVWTEYKRNLKQHANIDILDPELQAMALLTKGNQQQALPLLIKAVENDPYNLTARYTLASIYRQQGDLAQAIKYLQQIVEQQEGAPSAQIHLELGKLLRKQGKEEEGLQQFASASDWAAAFQYQNYRIHTELKQIYEEMKNTEGIRQEQKWLDEFEQAQAESLRSAAGHPTSAP